MSAAIDLEGLTRAARRQLSRMPWLAAQVEADDLAQEAALRRHRGNPLGPARLLHAVAVDAARRLGGRHAESPKRVFWRTESSLEPRSEPGEYLCGSPGNESLLAGLSPRDARVLVLRSQGASWGAIGAAVGLCASQASERHRKALLRLEGARVAARRRGAA